MSSERSSPSNIERSRSVATELEELLDRMLHLRETDQNPAPHQVVRDAVAAPAVNHPMNNTGLFTANSPMTSTLLPEDIFYSMNGPTSSLQPEDNFYSMNGPMSSLLPEDNFYSMNGPTSSLLPEDKFYSMNGPASSLLPEDNFYTMNGPKRSHNMYHIRTRQEEEQMVMERDMCYLQYKVDSCKHHADFLSVLDWILCRQRSLFLRNALFDRQGIYCLAKIIKNLKHNDYLACFLTSILAIWINELMTNTPSKVLILNCLAHLGDLANHVLHQAISFNAYSLATHQVGCISLNECIDIIPGKEKEMLLRHIAGYSVYLAYDIHGNYVLQHVLEQRYKDVNYVIIGMLTTHFVALSQLKEGSHVVEKCLDCCWDFGITEVVDAILHESSGEKPYLLARHAFGNYVIQKALRKTAEKPDEYRDRFNILVKSLKPRTKELQHTAGGKRVVSLIMELESYYGTGISL